MPWINVPEVERFHTNWSTMTEYRTVMQHAAAVASSVNRAADQLKLPSGGYGYLGVCHVCASRLLHRAIEL